MFMEDGIGELSKLPNIGKTVEEQLIKVGINTPDELRTVGAKTAWLKIQEIIFKDNLGKVHASVSPECGYLEFYLEDTAKIKK